MGQSKSRCKFSHDPLLTVCSECNHPAHSYACKFVMHMDEELMYGYALMIAGNPLMFIPDNWYQTYCSCQHHKRLNVS